MLTKYWEQVHAALRPPMADCNLSESPLSFKSMMRLLWVDWVMWLGLPLVSTAIAIAAYLTPQTWSTPKILVTVGAVWACWIVGLLQLWHKWKARPDFVLACGARVWTNGQDIKPADVERAIRVCVKSFPELLPSWGVTEDDLARMYSMAAIEFVRRPILWGGKCYAGIQRAHYMRVQWLGGFARNAFVHESIHMIHEVPLQMDPDSGHALTAWWQQDSVVRKRLT